jgi:hypothetical protein
MNCEFCTSTKKLRNDQEKISHYCKAHWSNFVDPFLDVRGLKIDEITARGFFESTPGSYVCMLCNLEGPFKRPEFKKHLHTKHCPHVVKQTMV